MKPEQQMHRSLCAWLKIAYPCAYFDSDPSGLRVSVGLRAILKSTRSNHAHLDLFIAEPRGQYHGMFIELKSKTPFKKDGTLKIIYTVSAEPGGKLPDWLVNSAVVDIPYNTFTNLKATLKTL